MRILLNPSGGRVVLAAKRAYVLGRDPDCEVTVQDMICSREHARITVDADGKTVYIEDLGSRNGTFVNDGRIEEKTKLNVGCRIQIGATIFLLSLATVPVHKQLSLLDAGTLNSSSLGGLDVGDDEG